MNGWKTIDTAPKDGTEILTFNPHYRGGMICSCNYSPESASSKTFLAKYFNVYIFKAGWFWGDILLEHAPTHWMPLPEAPE